MKDLSVVICFLCILCAGWLLRAPDRRTYQISILILSHGQSIPRFTSTKYRMLVHAPAHTHQACSFASINIKFA